MMVETQGMPDLERDLEMAAGMAQAEVSLEKFLLPLGMAAVALGGSAACHYAGIDVGSTLSAFREDPQAFLQTYLDGLGPLAVVYFGGLYVAAELLAIPATPLTLSAGYLFGFTEGSLVVLAAGTLSACIGFFIGKTLLRQWVESVLEENPQMKKLDNAIGSEGFKLLVLVRLSPIFPFSLLNYTYGASSISFPTFVTGTLLGFTPSTLGYVYTGLAGKELLLGEGTQPWYVYACALTVLLGFLKLVTDVATDIVGAMDEEPESIL
ncbi:transmembrane protein 41A [Seminavis robusta]|uniref:Transmembrane protein 41A n=1 Tax=Seminavis robusta TaxID=568900 RepID=A0A9N8D858_9STRA|nr:transmembrane protein 41A [Seminavis robusta]|eukprot:Sro27_g018160.1 transmembrane protein 41A (266) ;mRNA; f:83137-83934